MIIPAYEAAQTIGQAVSSALGQDFPPHEIIICDDGSTDDIQAALEPFATKIQVVHQTNQGLSSARNAACRAATGDWIVLLDADDEWLPTRLSRIEEMIHMDPSVDIVTTDAVIRCPGRPDLRWYADRPWPSLNDQPSAILQGSFIFAGAAVRRAALERVGLFTVGLPHDSEWEAWVRLLLSGSRAALVEEPLAIYHVHNAPRLSSRRAANHQMVIAVLEGLRGNYGPTVDELTESLLPVARRRLAIAEGVDAVRSGSRLGCLKKACASEVPAIFRMKFALAALAPTLAAKRL